MSSSILIAKQEEWSRRKATYDKYNHTDEPNSTMDSEKEAHSRDATAILAPPNGATKLVDSETTTTTTKRVGGGAFVPVVEETMNGPACGDTKPMVEWSPSTDDTELSSRSSPASMASTTATPTWITTTSVEPLSSSSSGEDGAEETSLNRDHSYPCNDEDEDDDDDDAAARIEQLETTLHEARRELVRLQKAEEAAVSQRSKTLGNLKKKRTELAQALSETKKLQEQLHESSQQQRQLEDETASLKLGLSKLALTKDTIKLKLKTKDELLKESCKEKEALKGQLQQLAHYHSLERELLEHYRKLARHTGYHRWGKPIRHLEHQLAERAGNGSVDGSGHASPLKQSL